MDRHGPNSHEERTEIDMSMAEKAKVVDWNDQEFKNEIGSGEGLTVVDFWAPWCGPCRIVGPVIEELAAEYDGEVRFAKVNVDEAQQTAATFGIRSIPTIGFFHGGEPVGGVVGAYPKDALKQAIEHVRSEIDRDA